MDAFRENQANGVPKYILASILCSFGGFLFGMDTGIIGPVTVMASFTQAFGTHSPTVHGLIVSAILIPAAFSAFFAGRFADILGRPTAIALGAAIFGLGTALEAGAVHIGMFATGRCIEGVGEGLYLGTLVVYICEISPPAYRGPLTTGPQLLITMGIVTGFFTCYGSENIDSSLSWRTPFIILTTLALSFSALSILFLPASPRWLTLHGRHAEALAVWNDLGVESSQREKLDHQVEVGVVSVPTSEPMTRASSPKVVERIRIIERTRSRGSVVKAGFLGMFAKDVRVRTLMAAFLMGMQQLSGIDGVLYYAPLLFQQAGLASTKASFLASGISALLIFAFTIPALIFSDKWGRRGSTIYGGCGLAAIMFLIGSLYASNSVHTTGPARWIVILSIYAFAIVYCISWAVGIKVYAAEIQPQRTRASATSLAHGSNWITNFLVALTTPVLLAKSSYAAYFLWGGCTIVTAGVCWIWMPETRGRSLEEIEEAFKKTGLKAERYEQREGSGVV
ncbi:putative MFS sugar transporter [Tricladium varicosporioides]|nr:putative MFS sugar transporter [Hymenoscyphus varicosporioides]